MYAESNFVLELALGQEQCQACETILEIAEAGRIELTIPAFSIMEPYQKITRRQRDREQLRRSLDQERAEVARISEYQDPAEQLQNLATFLISSSERDEARMRSVRERLLTVCRITPLNADVLNLASQLSERFGLSAEDAVVLASVHSDIGGAAATDVIFLTRNSKDFNDPDIQQFLGCRIMFDFDDSLALVRKLTSADHV